RNDSPEPGPNTGRSNLELFRHMPEAQERLLGDILGFCIVLEHPARDRENRWKLPANQHAECGGIAAPGTQDEGGIRRGGACSRVPARSGPGCKLPWFYPTFRHCPSPFIAWRLLSAGCPVRASWAVDHLP